MATLISVYKHYISFKKSEEGKNWERERSERAASLKKVFSRRFLEEASDAEFEEALREVFSSLWAMDMWVKKEERFQNIFKKNKIQNLRKVFLNLLYGSGQIGERFDKFLKNTWGLGPAAASEILCFVEPKKYAMWNRKVGIAIEKLGFDEEFRSALGIRGKTRPPKVQMDGKKYERFLDFMNGLRKELKSVTGQVVDFLELDFFLYYVAKGPKPAPKPGEALKSHAEAQYYLLALGRLLGYPTYVAKHDRTKHAFGRMLGEVANETDLPSVLRNLKGIRNPEEVDVMWLDKLRKRPIYAFEVSHTTDVAKDAMVLKDLLWTINMNRGFIVIPDYREKEFEKLKHSSSFGDVIRKGKLGVITYSQLLELYKKGQAFIGLLNEIGIKLCEY